MFLKCESGLHLTSAEIPLISKEAQHMVKCTLEALEDIIM